MTAERLSLFQALNSVAVSLQRSAHSEAEVFDTYRREISRLGLRGNLSLIDPGGENLVMQITFIPGPLKTAVQQVDGFANFRSEGISFPIGQIEAYQQAIRTRQVLYIPDNREVIAHILPEGLKGQIDMIMSLLGSPAQIVAPLLGEEKVIGLLTLGMAEGITSEDIPAVQAFANHFVTALENAHLFAAAKRQAQERELLDRVLAALSRHLSLADVVHTVVEAIPEVFGYTQVSLYLVEDGQLHLQHQVGYETVIEWIPLTRGITGRVVCSGQPVLLEDVQIDPEFLGAISGITSEIGVPLRDKGQVVGVLNVESVKGMHLTEADLRLMLALSEHLNIAIERARLYEEIRHFNAQLEQRVRERTTQLEAALDELRSFSYSISHDLRAPLRGIQGFSHIILEENSDVLNQDARDHLRFIMDSARRMGVMIDALLLFSRLTRVEFQKIDLNLSGMVTEITQALVKSDPPRKAQIRISPGLVCQADRKYIRIALENLLSNAWKFTSKTPKAVITFGSEMVDAQSVFFVRDNGAGFDMRYINKLFGAFQRLHRVDEFPGEGVGLAIAQRIIQRHGGRIWAEAEPGEGATFYFTLPA